MFESLNDMLSDPFYTISPDEPYIFPISSIRRIDIIAESNLSYNVIARQTINIKSLVQLVMSDGMNYILDENTHYKLYNDVMQEVFDIEQAYVKELKGKLNNYFHTRLSDDIKVILSFFRQFTDLSFKISEGTYSNNRFNTESTFDIIKI
jgi:hypothetical protein